MKLSLRLLALACMALSPKTVLAVDDIETQPPVLTAPATGAATNTPVTISYSLPEAALADSVKVTFDDGVNPEVILVLSETTAGAHSITFDSFDPVSTDGVVGPEVPDGTYTVTLSYQDALGNPEASSAASTNVKIDTTPPEITLLGDDPLILELGTSFVDPGATALDEGYGDLTASIAVDAGNLDPNVPGIYIIFYTVEDPLGNSTTEARIVQVYTTETSVSSLYTKGNAVPSAGLDPRVPTGATFTGFGSPAVDEFGSVAFLGKWKAPGSTGSGIFVNGDLVVKAGESASVASAPDAVFMSFKDPVVDFDGSLAFIAKIKGPGITTANNTVIVHFDSFNPGLIVEARTGDEAPGCDGAVWKSFTNASLYGGQLLFTGTLLQGSGTTVVTKDNDTGVWARDPDFATVTSTNVHTSNELPTSDLRLVVREGSGVEGLNPGETVKTFRILSSVAGSPGNGGQHRGIEATYFPITTSLRRQAVVDELGELIFLAGDSLYSETLPDAAWKTFGPIQTDVYGDFLALRGVLQKSFGVPANQATGIFLSFDYGYTFEPLAQLNLTPAPGTDGIFSALNDPVLSPFGCNLAFMGKAKGGTVTKDDDSGIWWSYDTGDLVLVAREGGDAPGAAPGDKFKSFSSLAVPCGFTGPIFTAFLRPSATVSNSNDFGLWGVDTEGNLRGLIREGDTVGTKTVKTFNVIKAVSGSNGVARAFNNNGAIVLLATFTDGTQGIIRIFLPAPPIS